MSSLRYILRSTVEPQSYGPTLTDCSVNRTLKLNKYLVSIIKIAIKTVRGNQILPNITKNAFVRFPGGRVSNSEILLYFIIVLDIFLQNILYNNGS